MSHQGYKTQCHIKDCHHSNRNIELKETLCRKQVNGLQAVLSGHPWLGISSINLRKLLGHPWPNGHLWAKSFLRFIEVINPARKVSGMFMQEIQWTLRENASDRRQERGGSSVWTLLHQPQNWSSEVSYGCASVCGLLLMLHMSLKMVQTNSVGPKISCGAKKQQKQHHGSEWLLGICLDLRNGVTPFTYWNHGDKWGLGMYG